MIRGPLFQHSVFCSEFRNCNRSETRSDWTLESMDQPQSPSAVRVSRTDTMKLKVCGCWRHVPTAAIAGCLSKPSCSTFRNYRQIWQLPRRRVECSTYLQFLQRVPDSPTCSGYRYQSCAPLLFGICGLQKLCRAPICLKSRRLPCELFAKGKCLLCFSITGSGADWPFVRSSGLTY